MKKMEKGFTLVELMIVVAIIAILAAVAIPNLTKAVMKSRDANAISILGNVRTNLSAAVADLEGNYPNPATVNGLWNGDQAAPTALTAVDRQGNPIDVAQVPAVTLEGVNNLANYATGTVRCGFRGTTPTDNAPTTTVTLNYRGPAAGLIPGDQIDNINIKFERAAGVAVAAFDAKGRGWSTY